MKTIPLSLASSPVPDSLRVACDRVCEHALIAHCYTQGMSPDDSRSWDHRAYAIDCVRAFVMSPVPDVASLVRGIACVCEFVPALRIAFAHALRRTSRTQGR